MVTSIASRTYKKYVGRGEPAEAGTLAATAVARFFPATNVCMITVVASVFCFEDGNGEGTVESERSSLDKRAEIALDVQVCKEENSRAKWSLSG